MNNANPFLLLAAIATQNDRARQASITSPKQANPQFNPGVDYSRDTDLVRLAEDLKMADNHLRALQLMGIGAGSTMKDETGMGTMIPFTGEDVATANIPTTGTSRRSGRPGAQAAANRRSLARNNKSATDYLNQGVDYDTPLARQALMEWAGIPEVGNTDVSPVNSGYANPEMDAGMAFAKTFFDLGQLSVDSKYGKGYKAKRKAKKTKALAKEALKTGEFKTPAMKPDTGGSSDLLDRLSQIFKGTGDSSFANYERLMDGM